MIYEMRNFIWNHKTTRHNKQAYGPLVEYVNLRVAHAPGMPETFSPQPRVSDPDMHHDMCVTHVLWCMSGSLTSGYLWSRWREKRSRHLRRMRNPHFHVSGKRCKPRVRRSYVRDPGVLSRLITKHRKILYEGGYSLLCPIVVEFRNGHYRFMCQNVKRPSPDVSGEGVIMIFWRISDILQRALDIKFTIIFLCCQAVSNMTNEEQTYHRISIPCPPWRLWQIIWITKWNGNGLFD